MNILIVRIGRMGDMVMVLPAIQEIFQKFPGATVYALSSKDGLRLLPLAGIERQRICVCRNGIWHRLIDTLRIKRLMADVTFDRVFCFQSKKWVLSWLPKEAAILYPDQQLMHYASRCLQLVSPAADISFQKKQPYLTVAKDKQQRLTEILETQGIIANTILVGLHPTYSGFDKWGRASEKRHRLWPASYFAALAKVLRAEAHKKKIDLKIVMNLLPREQKLGRYIVQLSQGSILLVPDFSDFQTYLAYLQRLNVLVVSNTGVMHLAAALATPLVALFSGMDPEDCGPYMHEKHCVVLRAEDTDAPENGLAAITVASVFDRVLGLTKGFSPS
ncbi:MAG: glycosyltransferase family 9 protein [Gammaproteobacteria bacterium]|nr:glycosyltransferase family 9 protein [Gammaproteobacteria bacterium]